MVMIGRCAKCGKHLTRNALGRAAHERACPGREIREIAQLVGASNTLWISRLHEKHVVSNAVFYVAFPNHKAAREALNQSGFELRNDAFCKNLYCKVVAPMPIVPQPTPECFT